MGGRLGRRECDQVGAVNMSRGAPEGRRLVCDEIPHLAGKEGDRAVQQELGAEGKGVPDRRGYPLDRNPPVSRDGPYEGVRDVRRDEGQAVSGPDHGFSCAGGIAQRCGDRPGRVENDADETAPDPRQEFEVIGATILVIDGGKDGTSAVENVTDQGPWADLTDGRRAGTPGDQPSQ